MLNTIQYDLFSLLTITTEGMTTGEKLLDGLLYTVIGMGITFVVLIVIAFVIWSLKFVNMPFQKEGSPAVHTNKNSNEKISKTEIKLEPSSKHTDSSIMDDKELVAVIMSAIAASLNTSTDQLIVRSIRKARAKNY